MNSGDVIMSVATQTKIDPAVRQAVLDHVARYRMTVLPAVQRIRSLHGYGHKRTAALLGFLCRTGHIDHAPLLRNRRYFHLAARGAAWCVRAGLFGEADHRHGPLSEGAKITNYAILTFCHLAGGARHRLTAGEFRRHFSAIYRTGVPMNYYVDTSRSCPKLGFIRVDTGGHGRWDRVLAKCRNDLEAHWTDQGFQPFIQRGAFVITLITALPQKANRLAESLAAWRDPRAGMIRICAVPELLSLIAPPPISKEDS